jgi:UrcA family protein
MIFSLVLCTLISTVSFADPRGRARDVTEHGIVSLADVDVLTPEGLRIASRRIQQMAQSLCPRMVNMDDPDASGCVNRAVRDAQRRLDAVIQARLAEREALAVASARSAE